MNINQPGLSLLRRIKYNWGLAWSAGPLATDPTRPLRPALRGIRSDEAPQTADASRIPDRDAGNTRPRLPRNPRRGAITRTLAFSVQEPTPVR
ncbi:MAG TPA: hypothetical protein VM512_09585, partial [Burkholderiaceae bacterium]|nr:hypothetical protein [Burkholderiaceae bacterium]